MQVSYDEINGLATVTDGFTAYVVSVTDKELTCGTASYDRETCQFYYQGAWRLQQVLQAVIDHLAVAPVIEVDPVPLLLYRVIVDGVPCEVAVKAGSFVRCAPCLYDIRTGIYSGTGKQAATAVKAVVDMLKVYAHGSH